MKSDPFQLSGADDRPIRGNLHPAADESAPVLLVCHGFKGYKDYGFFPYLCRSLAGRRAVVRFNFSHSGIGDDPATFQHPELFERDTYSKQIEDLGKVIDFVRDKLNPTGLAVLGHSRGGVTALLAAALDPRDQQIQAVVSLSAPKRANRFGKEITEQLRRDGFIVSPSSRTGQQLRIGKVLLDDIAQGGDARSVEAAVKRTKQPLCLLHGSADATVPAADAEQIAQWYNGTAELHILQNTDHVFNCKNPMTEPSAEITQVTQIADAFLQKHTL